jgi:hypothetical protein
MHSIDGTSAAGAMRHLSDRILHRARNRMASLRPAARDAIIISIFSVVIFAVEYHNDLAPQLFQFGPRRVSRMTSSWHRCGPTVVWRGRAIYSARRCRPMKFRAFSKT